MSVLIDKETIARFDIPGPRYTSYPTAPNWPHEFAESAYIQKLKAFGQSSKTLSLYIHIPFCRSLCSFCACNVIIREPLEKYGDEYLSYLFKEIDLVSSYIGGQKTIKQLHLGGGTPTFLTEEQLERLVKKIEEKFIIDKKGEVAIEVDPRTINESKIKKLRGLGFNRLSFGVQDFDPQVQESVNRIQSYKSVEDLTKWGRELRFDSINFDLIYGLPKQTKESFEETMDKVLALKPDRVALYSFAYVPWLKKHQNKLEANDFPSNDKKLEIFLHAREQFLSHGYEAIAMDHFALQTDELSKAFYQDNLYRNFMGYTVKPADEYIGLGLTSIGFLEKIFIQNHKVLSEYYALLEKNKLPVERGLELSDDDQIRQWVITSLMCHFKIDKDVFKGRFHQEFDQYFEQELGHIQHCVMEGLLQIEGQTVKATELGKIFIRNVCMGFDIYLQDEQTPRRFSRTV